ncbi:hypothetical protein BC832DRAFT_554891 [Gaertneriomyces semiglobifer]|nr:hypothetical protein BC832DRAFT_554891 [Gaertneriomyces semiglobifer]
MEAGHSYILPRINHVEAIQIHPVNTLFVVPLIFSFILWPLNLDHPLLNSIHVIAAVRNSQRLARITPVIITRQNH